MKVYRIDKYDNLKISEFELIKETEKSVLVKTPIRNGLFRQDRMLKVSDYYSFFKTQEEALKVLIDRAKRKLKYAESEVSKYTDVIQELQN